MAKAFQFRASFDQDILCDPEAAEATMRSLGAAHGRFLAFANHHQQIEIASFVGLAPGVRTE